ncbi:ParA family partition ATPase [Methyloparacoccus murrellii]
MVHDGSGEGIFMIVSVLNQKGGVGKTTLSVNLAATLALAGRRTLLIDADPQASALDWQASRDGESLFPVVGMARATLHKDVPGLAAQQEHVIIDGPPRVNELARSAIMASHLVVIPVQPSPYDIWAASDIVKLVVEAQVYNTGLRGVFVINRVVAKTAISRDVAEALKDYPFPLLQTAIAQRVVFAESAAAGLSVLEYAPRSPAAGEMRTLLREIEGLMACVTR